MRGAGSSGPAAELTSGSTAQDGAEKSAKPPTSVSAKAPFLGRMSGRDDDLPFLVELWDDKDLHVEEVIAQASDFFSATAPMTRR